MIRQLDLFAAPAIAPEITFDRAFASLERRELAYGAWVDYQRSFVHGHDALFERLERGLAWRTENRKMYDRVVATPRLLAKIPRTDEFAVIDQIRLALSERYGEEFVRTTAALYRDGSDSVAFHGDTTARNMVEALVATVSLGQPRRFLLKPTEGGSSIAYQLGHGDLCVMGGTCQRTWRHGIPKVAQALGPRIAVMFRPAWSADYDG
ncbi:MAG TPA: alpha-ketoglutarate-dependent dioxygenase AlkB [Kofleriaceae bacterium]|nr:alpha-ketoglutarate-dependent dioxygenase AlkB [Kofleriaceae bacterium]